MAATPTPRAVAPRRTLPAHRRAIAALEFALVAPLLLLMFGGVGQLGLEVWARGALANAVAQGAYYATLTYQSGGAVTASQIKTLVQNVSPLANVTASATVPAKYCAAGDPATLTATAATTCADGTAPGTYTTITASYTSAAILPAFTGLGTPTVVESVTVRLQ